MAAGHRAFGAARSVLDSREHDGILAASGPPMPPQLAAVYPRFLTAANSSAHRTYGGGVMAVEVGPNRMHGSAGQHREKADVVQGALRAVGEDPLSPQP